MSYIVFLQTSDVLYQQPIGGAGGLWFEVFPHINGGNFNHTSVIWETQSHFHPQLSTPAVHRDSLLHVS